MKVILRIAVAVWLVLVIAVSVTPLSFKLKLHTIGPYHDYGHFGVYALTGILLWIVALRWLPRIFAFLFGAALAISQEWAENRLFHAGFEWRDVGTDFAGLITGYALMILITALMTDESAARSRY